MKEKAKASLILLVICILTTVLPSAIWTESEWADLLGLLGAVGSMVAFIIAAIVILSKPNECSHL